MDILAWNETLNRIVFGFPMKLVYLLVGAYLVIFRIRWFSAPLRMARVAFSETLGAIRERAYGFGGQITPYQATMVALSATLGTGHLLGMLAAVLVGGPGAVFWMWVGYFFGTGTKFAEATLAVHYRRRFADGSVSGGPMYYLSRGLPRLRFLGHLFAFFAAVAAFGIGNLSQAGAVGGPGPLGGPARFGGPLPRPSGGPRPGRGDRAGGPLRPGGGALEAPPLPGGLGAPPRPLRREDSRGPGPGLPGRLHPGGGLGRGRGLQPLRRNQRRAWPGHLRQRGGAGLGRHRPRPGPGGPPRAPGVLGGHGDARELPGDLLTALTFVASGLWREGVAPPRPPRPSSRPTPWEAWSSPSPWRSSPWGPWSPGGFTARRPRPSSSGRAFAGPTASPSPPSPSWGPWGPEAFLAVSDTLNGLMALPNLLGLVLLGGVVGRLVYGFFRGEPWVPPAKATA